MVACYLDAAGLVLKGAVAGGGVAGGVGIVLAAQLALVVAGAAARRGAEARAELNAAVVDVLWV